VGVAILKSSKIFWTTFHNHFSVPLASMAGEEQNKIGCTNVTPFIRIGEF
jgi:hypothetical protein